MTHRQALLIVLATLPFWYSVSSLAISSATLTGPGAAGGGGGAAA